MQRVLVIIVVLAMSASLGALLFLRNRSRTPSTAEDYAHLPAKARPPALWPAPDFSFRAHTGETASKASLTGKPYIANFIFTTCRTVCPLLTTKMVRLQRQLPGVDVRFVSFSVDPEHDTVDALAAYAKQWNADESRWLLLETTPDGLAKVAEGFHVTAQKTDGGLDAVMHSAVFLLVDAQGVVRGAFDSETPEDFTALLAQTRALVGKPSELAAKPPRTGEELFHELSCTNCHERAELAPPLGGLKGQRRTLDTGLLVNADDAYVKESILSPDAKRVAGFPLRMPSYVGLLSDDELKLLVDYVSALPASVAAAPDVAVAVDPVCHMKVRVTENALQSTSADGGVTHFCSAWCQSRFAENPDAYRQ